MALRPNRVLLIIFLLLCLLACSLFAAAPPIPQQPAHYVVDLAGIIDPQTEADLNRRLKELESQTTAQVVVLTLDSLEGEPIEQVSLRTAERWALGQKGKDNGVLITVAVQDRKYRIEVGYGLEAILPDSLVGSIGRECFVPNFRAGKYSEGISDAVKTITRRIIGKPIQIKEESARKRQTDLYFLLALLFAMLVLLGAIIFDAYFPISDEWRPSDESSAGSWGGFGGGGFGGGFSGGGGGFGGGGISGNW